MSQNTMPCFDEEINILIKKYNSIHVPIDVSFRSLIPNFNPSERATHFIHPYPAKLLAHIPYFFLNNNILSNPGDNVLDPFCGSGTVVLESILANRNCVGVDINPLARLISKVKTNVYELDVVKKYTKSINQYFFSTDIYAKPEVVNINYWYSNVVQNSLSKIKSIIDSIDNEKYRDYFLMNLSICSRKLSKADPRVSVPVKLKRLRNTNNISDLTLINECLYTEEEVLLKFNEVVENNNKRFDALKSLLAFNVSAKIIDSDARYINKNNDNKIELNSIDLIITSPPYAGAQKYIRASSLNLGWTGLSTVIGLRDLDKLCIGRENYRKSEYISPVKTNVNEANTELERIYNIYPLRAHIASSYINEMEEAFSEIVKVLKPGGYFVLIAANNQICGKEFHTQEYLKMLAINLGLKVELELIDDIHSYGLMTKRNKTASIITREWVTVFKKD